MIKVPFVLLMFLASSYAFSEESEISKIVIFERDKKNKFTNSYLVDSKHFHDFHVVTSKLEPIENRKFIYFYKIKFEYDNDVKIFFTNGFLWKDDIGKMYKYSQGDEAVYNLKNIINGVKN